MNITLLKVTKPFSEYEKYLPYASGKRIAKIKSIKSDTDKAISLLSHLLAKSEASKALGIPFDSVVFSENEYGKPYIENAPYHFSISHSGNLIAFISHTSPVGIDVQKINDSVSPALRFFTPNEKSYVSDDHLRFYEVWTKKEAYIKMLGTGLSTPLSSFDVLTKDIGRMLFSTTVGGFSLSVCTEELPEINILTKSV